MQVGTSWGGEYSRWSFDESKAYMLLAKEQLGPSGQSVPLLDDELNCQAEMQLTLLRRAIKRLLGNGTDNDGFKIVESASSTSNNFKIKGGDGTLSGAGYMFVEGWMPFNLSDIEYNAQSWAVTLTTPSAARTDQVYLDCWLEEIAGTDDSTIIDASVGFETSRRLKLSWKITVDEGAAISSSFEYTDSNNVLHYRTRIAKIIRTASANILTSMITDTRNIERGQKKNEFIHIAHTANVSWYISHNLGTEYINIDIWNSDGEKLDAPVEIVDENHCQVLFGSTYVQGHACVRGITSNNFEYI